MKPNQVTQHIMITVNCLKQLLEITRLQHRQTFSTKRKERGLFFSDSYIRAQSEHNTQSVQHFTLSTSWLISWRYIN